MTDSQPIKFLRVGLCLPHLLYLLVVLTALCNPGCHCNTYLPGVEGEVLRLMVHIFFPIRVATRKPLARLCIMGRSHYSINMTSIAFDCIEDRRLGCQPRAHPSCSWRAQIQQQLLRRLESLLPRYYGVSRRRGWC
ncbi:hypothetical protein GGR55DRAFT_280984 [Xylaria sp. FL0064]|nr:hypothetical protein GGR55DRAFT_280984 [Xylaria sp. FL0064]